jgi:hypothetical protein
VGWGFYLLASQRLEVLEATTKKLGREQGWAFMASDTRSKARFFFFFLHWTEYRSNRAPTAERAPFQHRHAAVVENKTVLSKTRASKKTRPQLASKESHKFTLNSFSRS